ncbi:unnamed protein product [Trichogramma brassicae]|uniref:Uncharacterized protein n=1 Tax=Trichogramma brassicae TaxID=86971 RepID=A0A6H5I5K0_9HYME|nr:unnamed protein product [Trichogramma brassicae]
MLKHSGRLRISLTSILCKLLHNTQCQERSRRSTVCHRRAAKKGTYWLRWASSPKHTLPVDVVLVNSYLAKHLLDIGCAANSKKRQLDSTTVISACKFSASQQLII